MSGGQYAFLLDSRGAHARIPRVELRARLRATLVDVMCCQPRLHLTHPGAEVSCNA